MARLLRCQLIVWCALGICTHLPLSLICGRFALSISTHRGTDSVSDSHTLERKVVQFLSKRD